MAPAKGAADTAGLTEWERARAENLKANQAALSTAGATAAKIFANVRRDIQKKQASAPRRSAKHDTQSKPSKPSTLPTRRSARVAGNDADAPSKRSFEDMVVVKEEEERAKKRRIGGTVDLSSIAVDGKAWGRSGEGLASLQLFSRGAQPHIRTFTDADVKETTDASLKELREVMSGLALYDKFEVKDLKLTKERIYAMTFHPTEEKAVIIAGDKEGRLGIFDASQGGARAANGDDDDDDDAEPDLPIILGYKPHGRTISSFQFSPSDSQFLYTSSYDSSIRKQDLVKDVSVEVYAPPDDSDADLAISCLDVSGPHILFFSTLDGRVYRYDVRTSPSEAEGWAMHDVKIGGFSLDPRNPHLLATASLDRTLKIWDTRKMTGRGEDRHPHLVGEHGSSLSVSHASWSSSGHVATSSYDNTIKVYDFSDAGAWGAAHDISEEDMAPAHTIPHNNQTGRWVTILKPQWQSHPRDGIDKFAVGNMNRFVDVFAANGEQLAQLDGDGITAVPAVAHFHPTMPWVAGGNASGKLSLWM